MRAGPLKGIRIIEFAGLGPAPMAAMLLADLGAQVVTIDRLEPSGLGIPRPAQYDVYRRNRGSLAIDLKAPEGITCVLDLIAQADALIEGFRPGTMERLGLGPQVCLERNPRLVFGRVTGWGQDGPLAHSAGHDLNFIALSGVLSMIGRAGEPPTVPLNLIGDYGGGAMLLALGIACGLIEARQSGLGQVVDAAMAEGAATLAAAFFGLASAGLHGPERGTNILDSGAPFYDVYRCADGKWVSVAPIEAKFRSELLVRLGFDAAQFPAMEDRANWPEARRLLEARFAEQPRDHWSKLLEGTDACFSPVLALDEAPAHHHCLARGSFVTVDGVVQPAPVPRFSRTPAGLPTGADSPGGSGRAVLADWGMAAARIAKLEAMGIIPHGNDNRKG